MASDRLRDTIREKSVGHAYLLTGQRGAGKSALARAFAQALCCPNIDPDDPSQPCGQCRSCRNVQRGVHPDVEVFSLESQARLAEKPAARGTLSIETVRSLRSAAALLPLEASRRIVIVDDAETMLEPAQQALLKTLEEPPPAVTILLLADESETLLATVRSRCQQIAVRAMTEPAVEQSLLERGTDPELAREIAELSRGCPAWAIEVAANGNLLQERRAERDAAAAWLTAPEYDRLVTAFTLGEQFGKRRAEVIGVVQAAIQSLREEMVRAAASSLPQEVRPGSGLPSALMLSKAVAGSLRCLADLEANVRPKLALEAMVLQWPNMDSQRRA
ncbi:MAG: ATP-binding protein [Thermomicrobiales bacterium]